MESKSRMMAYGLMGYQGPLPRATRSLRTRSSAYRKKNVAGRNMVPFELLASVAEDLLQQRDLEKQNCNKTTSTRMGAEICREIMAVDENDAEQALLELERSHVPKSSLRSSTNSLLVAKPELDDQASSDENAVAEFAAYRKLQLIQEGPCKNQEEHMEIRRAAIQEKKNGCNNSRKQFCDVEIGEGKGENEIDDANNNAFGRWNKGSSGPRGDDDDMMMMMFLDAHSPPATSGISEETPISAAEAKAPPPLVSSDSSGGVPSSAGNSRQDSFFNCQSTMIDFSKDEDVNSSECNTPTRLCKRPLKTYSKQRKGTAVKQRTTLPPCLKKRIHSEMDSVVNHGFLDRRSSARPVKPTFREGYTYQRGGTRRTPSKRRRISAEETAFPMFDGHTSTASATGVESNAEDGEPMVSVETKSTEKYVGAAPSSIASATEDSKDSSDKSDEQHVTVAIKSFTVPELSINMPTSASVASLKRAVMEAAMKLLGDGLRVCVLLQGKKVADESSNLEQLGIQHDGILDSVGFMLEPNPIPTSQTGNDDPLFVLSEAAASQPQSGFTMGPFGHMNSVELTKTVGKGRSSRANVNAEVAPANKAQTQLSPWTKCENEGDKDATSQAVGAANPGALILHPSLGATENAAQGLALVPLNSKSREIGKRRIRRPFTVAEVEALVHAVEKLGTGRWRDVKLRAFEHAKHRTYVDLKDKWKTLVHTARIAPHQRRGEPVPQELLDRVIRAHNFWTDQQAKQQAEVCL